MSNRSKGSKGFWYRVFRILSSFEHLTLQVIDMPGDKLNFDVPLVCYVRPAALRNFLVPGRGQCYSRSLF